MAENGLLAFFKALLAYYSVADVFIYAKPNKRNKKANYSGDSRLGMQSNRQ